MDPRRASRTVIDPKVRQVGFVTPGAQPAAQPQRAHSVPADALSSSPPAPDLSFPTGNSFSPVMIPPARHASVPVPVTAPAPLSPLRRDAAVALVVGSYNPSESLMGTSPLMSPSSGRFDAGSEFSEEASTWIGRGGGGGKVASSFPGSSGEMMVVKVGANAPAKSSLTTASVVRTLPGMSGTRLASQALD